MTALPLARQFCPALTKLWLLGPRSDTPTPPAVNGFVPPLTQIFGKERGSQWSSVSVAQSTHNPIDTIATTTACLPPGLGRRCASLVSGLQLAGTTLVGTPSHGSKIR